MKPSYHLKSLAVDCFRGARKKLLIALDKKLNIVTGPNGSGKSTITTGIEYGLYPREATLQKEHGIDERRGWEVKNVLNSGQPFAALTLTSGDGELTICNTASKARKPQGRPGDPRVCCSYSDFRSLVFMHQETLRDFLVGAPTTRERAYQRLLGVGWAQELEAAIGRATKQLSTDEVDQRVQSINNTIYARMSEARRQLEGAEAVARTKGLIEPWAQTGADQARTAEMYVESLCYELGNSVPALPELEPMHDYSCRLAPLLKTLRVQGPARKHSDLARQKTLIEAARAQYESARQNHKSAQAAYDSAAKQWGTGEEISKLTTALKESEQRAIRARSKLNQELAVIQEALHYFRDLPQVDTCPVCGSKISGSISTELEHHLVAISTNRDQKLAQELDAVRGNLRELSQASATLAVLKVNVERTAAMALEAQNGIETAVQRQIRSDEDPGAVVAAEIRRLEGELATVSTAVQERQERLNRAEASAKLVDQLGQILVLQQRVLNLGQIKNTPGWAAMMKAQQSLAQREQLLKHAEVAVKEMAAGMAEDNLNRSIEPIANIYRKLTLRGDFPNVSINPADGFNIEVDGSHGKFPATAVLNLTDLNSLAIAVVSGMATTFSECHDLGFLILDDPSQCMDAVVARRLGEVISELSEKIQVVVATPDLNLLEVLEQSPRQKNIIRLKPRACTSSETQVEIESIAS